MKIQLLSIYSFGNQRCRLFFTNDVVHLATLGNDFINVIFMYYDATVYGHEVSLTDTASASGGIRWINMCVIDKNETPHQF